MQLIEALKFIYVKLPFLFLWLHFACSRRCWKIIHRRLALRAASNSAVHFATRSKLASHSSSPQPSAPKTHLATQTSLLAISLAPVLLSLSAWHTLEQTKLLFELNPSHVCNTWWLCVLCSCLGFSHPGLRLLWGVLPRSCLCASWSAQVQHLLIMRAEF